MFAIYFAGSAAAILATFGLDLAPETRLQHVLPDRPDGVRRVRQLHVLPAGAVSDAAARHGRGLLLQHRPHRRVRRPVHRRQGIARAQGTGDAIATLFYVGFIPAAGLLILPWIVETKGTTLAD